MLTFDNYDLLSSLVVEKNLCGTIEHNACGMQSLVMMYHVGDDERSRILDVLVFINIFARSDHDLGLGSRRSIWIIGAVVI